MKLHAAPLLHLLIDYCSVCSLGGHTRREDDYSRDPPRVVYDQVYNVYEEKDTPRVIYHQVYNVYEEKDASTWDVRMMTTCVRECPRECERVCERV